jgi:transposase
MEVDKKTLLHLKDEEFRELFTARSTIDNKRYSELMTFFEEEKIKTSEVGFTFLFHYTEYCHKVSHPYSYTQFMEHYNRKYKQAKGSMKLNHAAGKEMFIDYTGKRLEMIDKVSGEIQQVEVFVATLPCSQYTYIEACKSQKKEDLVRCTENALHYFQGAPKAIVSDNLKSAVRRSHKYEPVINKTFKDFAQHYGCVVNPTRSYSPQDKALVEGAVKLVYQQIFYPIREMEFFNLVQVNKELHARLDNYNDRLFQQKGISRKELFQAVERPELSSLPPQKYEMSEFKRAKVQKMGYISLSEDKSYYSVPFRYIGKQVQVKYSTSLLEVFYLSKRIALHQREGHRHYYYTIKEHLASTHQEYLEWSPDFFLSKAKNLGEEIHTYVTQMFVMNKKEYPEHLYKRILGIFSLQKSYSLERINAACLRASIREVYSYHAVKNILEKGLDTITHDLNDLDAEKRSLTTHTNIRGAEYYQ